MSVDLEQVREALAGVGEMWNYVSGKDADDYVVLSGTIFANYVVAKCVRDEDAHLIANAPEWLRQMADELEKLRAEIIKALRKQTNFGIMDCKLALVACSWDYELSIEYLRRVGQSTFDHWRIENGIPKVGELGGNGGNEDKQTVREHALTITERERDGYKSELKIQEDMNVTLQKENDILRARISEIGEMHDGNE